MLHLIHVVIFGLVFICMTFMSALHGMVRPAHAAQKLDAEMSAPQHHDMSRMPGMKRP